MEHIVIVGGGSAGWMSAAYLSRVLQGLEPATRITLIESPDIGTIGVGEATIPPIRDFFALAGITEQELINNANAAIKNAIKFVGWKQGRDEHYFHPFEGPQPGDGFDSAMHWYALQAQGIDTPPLAESTGVHPALCAARKVPRPLNGPDFTAPVNYAYHIDALLMARLLRDKALQRGVRRIEDTVTAVTRDTAGNIHRLHTKQHGDIGGDLFIDCTGFYSLLIEKNLAADWHSYDDELLCDAAVAMGTERDPQQRDPLPFTLATARDAGWTWRIELSSRNGNGYVYSTRHLDAEQAEADLRGFLGEEAANAEARHLKMRVGRRNRFWIKNCVAIGLSGGFIEPLESTGLQFINVGLRYLFDHLQDPGAAGADSSRDCYNQLMRDYYDETKDFIVLHYALTARSDTAFWRAVQNVELSPWLRERLAVWRGRLPHAVDFRTGAIFSDAQYLYVLAGMNGISPEDLHFSRRLPEARARRALQRTATLAERAVQVSPRHGELLSHIAKPQG